MSSRPIYAGYGDSSAPPEEPDRRNYSFRAMAQDQVEVMQALGYDRSGEVLTRFKPGKPHLAMSAGH
jgi:hypothetical protein